MANTGFISLAPEIAAVAAAIVAHRVATDATGVIVADIHDTDLPAVATIVAETGAIALDIHDTDIPAQNLGVKSVAAQTAETTWQELLNLTTNGILHEFGVRPVSTGDEGSIRATIDGTIIGTINANTLAQWSAKREVNSSVTIIASGVEGDIEKLLNIPFKTSLLIEYKRTAGTGSVWGKAIYSIH